MEYKFKLKDVTEIPRSRKRSKYSELVNQIYEGWKNSETKIVCIEPEFDPTILYGLKILLRKKDNQLECRVSGGNLYVTKKGA